MADLFTSPKSQAPRPLSSGRDHNQAIPHRGVDTQNNQTRGLGTDRKTAERYVRDALTSADIARHSTNPATHEAKEASMARLQQVHPDIHHSVRAINHLKDQQAQGDKSDRTKALLKEAQHNLNARLGRANNNRVKSDTRVGADRAGIPKADTRRGPMKQVKM